MQYQSSTSHVFYYINYNRALAKHAPAPAHHTVTLVYVLLHADSDRDQQPIQASSCQRTTFVVCARASVAHHTAWPTHSFCRHPGTGQTPASNGKPMHDCLNAMHQRVPMPHPQPINALAAARHACSWWLHANLQAVSTTYSSTKEVPRVSLCGCCCLIQMQQVGTPSSRTPHAQA